jgi:LPS-assembly lipoprotein
MSSFRAYFLLGILAILSSCGFQPLYGGAENAAINQQLARIQIRSIEENLGQEVHNFLLDRLNSSGRRDKPLFTLDVNLTVVNEEIALKVTEEATRAKLSLILKYILRDNSSGDILSEGTIRSVSGYNISNSEFTRMASESDARERASRDVADEIKTRLSLYFSQRDT